MQNSTIKDESRRSFSGLASEYYNPNLHPTCENFRAASRLLIEDWLFDRRLGTAVEVGCGASLLAEVLTTRQDSLAGVTLTDISSQMLAYSNKYRSAGAQLVVASSDDLPLSSASQDALVSCLGDPYNDLDFWNEAARVLTVGGQLLFTTPSFEWSKGFRALLPVTLQSKAEFITAEGHTIWIPSCILPDNSQSLLMERAGFQLLDIKRMYVKNIPQPLSTKLAFLEKSDLPVVTGFFAERL